MTDAVEGHPALVDDPAAGAVAEQSARLRAALLALRQPGAAKRAPAPRSSVWSRTSSAVPGEVQQAASRALLAPRVRNAETTALLPGTSLVLLLVPDEGPLPPSLQRSTGLVAGTGCPVVVLGPQLPRDVSRTAGRPVCVPLRRDDPVSGEWALVACSPTRRSAFVARADGGDRWSWLLTRDAVAVHRAATALLDRVPFLGLRVPGLTG